MKLPRELSRLRVCGLGGFSHKVRLEQAWKKVRKCDYLRKTILA